MELLRTGLDDRDVAQLAEASALMSSCGTKIVEAQPLLETFVAENQ